LDLRHRAPAVSQTTKTGNATFDRRPSSNGVGFDNVESDSTMSSRTTDEPITSRAPRLPALSAAMFRALTPIA
jgi:hypothetical protein